MFSSLLTPEQEANAQRLAELIRAATNDDFLHIARLLVTKEERNLFGETEFTLRDILLRAGAKAYETFLREKKTATEGPA
jgi:parvulin-like peptidyl-prolyl isomerase